ncbi:MAG: homocysteine S-methyltransferase family protein [Eubacteriales bacterium]
MNFISCYETNPIILMEGALGERLKREYHIPFDEFIALANVIYRDDGKKALYELWNQYIDVARDNNIPFIATTPTRRANKERVAKAGYDKNIIRDNVFVLKQLRDVTDIKMYIGGLMGCKGDAYKATEALQPDEAKLFHSWQADLFMQFDVDFLYAAIMPTLPETIGMAMAMEQTQLPYIISFMLLENGKLLDGTNIHDAISEIDNRVNRKPICYMANCIHPVVLYKALNHHFNQTSLVKQRFHGIQANTSALSPHELDNSKELKCSDSIELAQAMFKLKEIITLKIVGGCCGTNNNHISQIAKYFTKKKEVTYD